MKILLINTFYNIGSTGKIVHDIEKYIKKKTNHTVECLYSWGSIGNSKDNCYASKIDKILTKVLVYLFGYRYGFSYFSTYKLIKKIKKIKPDIINLHCSNAFDVNLYYFIKYCNRKKLNLLITEHAEYYYTANCSYAYDCNKWMDGCNNCKIYKQVTKARFFDTTKKSWELMYNAFNKYENKPIIICVSDWLKDRSLKGKITNSCKHFTIKNGINTNIFNNNYYDKKLTQDNYILHITPDFSLARKGGHYLIELARKNKDKQFYVIGKYDKTKKYPNNIKFLGLIRNQKELAKYYNNAKLTILLSERETFSMIVPESLCCGTPIIGFLAGAPETITIKKYSEFVEYGNIDNINEKLNLWYNKVYNKDKISKDAMKIYSSEKMGENYLNLFYESLNIKK